MFAHLQLAVVALGTLACLVQLFGGLFDSSRDVFYAAPIALMALLPVAAMPRSPTSLTAAWVLAALFGAGWIYSHQGPGSRVNAFDVLEWAMLTITLRAIHRRNAHFADA